MIEPLDLAAVAPSGDAAWERNPFSSDLALANGSYCAYREGDLVRLPDDVPPSVFARVAHTTFRDFVRDDAFSCLGARAALGGGTYRFGTYRRLDDAASTQGLARDLFAFSRERRSFRTPFTTYVAVFAGYERGAQPEMAFERALWRQLDRLHVLDREYHTWDPRVAKDPDDPAFSYSFAGTAFFVVGLHPDSVRSARRFAWPMLAFNAHEQFETLRVEGTFERLQQQIRRRELRLDGSLNGNLSDYGKHSEATQYSGRLVEPSWRCPFKPQ